MTVDKAKQREVGRDISDHDGQLLEKAWDGAIVTRRNRVMQTYCATAAVLAQSHDPEDRALARATERFAAGLTDVTTERVVLAREVRVEQAADRTGLDPGRFKDRSRTLNRGAGNEKPERKHGPDR